MLQKADPFCGCGCQYPQITRIFLGKPEKITKTGLFPRRKNLKKRGGEIWFIFSLVANHLGLRVVPDLISSSPSPPTPVLPHLLLPFLFLGLFLVSPSSFLSPSPPRSSFFSLPSQTTFQLYQTEPVLALATSYSPSPESILFSSEMKK